MNETQSHKIVGFFLRFFNIILLKIIEFNIVGFDILVLYFIILTFILEKEKVFCINAFFLKHVKHVGRRGKTKYRQYDKIMINDYINLK